VKPAYLKPSGWSRDYCGVTHLLSVDVRKHGLVSITTYDKFALAQLTPRGTFTTCSEKTFREGDSKDGVDGGGLIAARAWAEGRAKELGWLP
jgi:hypothetical protein